jgi:hypothetical protein
MMRATALSWLQRGVSLSDAHPPLKPFNRLDFSRPALDAAAPPLAPEAAYLAEPAALLRGASLAPRALYDARCNIILTRRGRILRDTDNVWREFPDKKFHQRYYWRYHYTRPCRDLDGVCMAFRSPANNYYHTLVDNLPRLYWLHHPALADRPVRVLLPAEPYRWESYFLDRLLPSNARVERVDPAWLWRAEQMVVGDYLSEQMSGALPRAYLDFFLPRVLPDRPRQRRHRIYISRRQAPGGRRILNEDALRRMMETRGFTTYLLESLDIAQQIELFYDATCVVAPHGAGLTNLLFAESAEVIELHPSASVMPHYYFMARAMGHRYHGLSANAAGRDSSFEVDIGALARVLDGIESGRRGGDIHANQSA